jgi:phage-related minor tail protein
VVEYSQVVAKLDADAMGVGIDQKNFDVTTPAQHSSDIDSKKQLLLSKWQGRFKWVPKEVKVYRQILVLLILILIH